MTHRVLLPCLSKGTLCDCCVLSLVLTTLAASSLGVSGAVRVFGPWTFMQALTSNLVSERNVYLASVVVRTLYPCSLGDVLMFRRLP
jgi:hypothetical protein